MKQLETYQGGERFGTGQPEAERRRGAHYDNFDKRDC